jgi:hypothetical protein
MRFSTLAALAARAFGLLDHDARELYRPLQREGLLPRGQRGPGRSCILEPRHVAIALTARLVTGRPARVVEKVCRYGVMPCIQPIVINPDDPEPLANIEGVPSEWEAVRALPIGHNIVQLVEALLIDSAAGRMEVGAIAWHFIEFRSYAPVPRITVGLTSEGRDAIEAGGWLADAVSAAAIKAEYGRAHRLYPDLKGRLAEATASLLGEKHSAVSTEIAFELDVIYEFGRAMAEDPS